MGAQLKNDNLTEDRNIYKINSSQNFWPSNNINNLHEINKSANQTQIITCTEQPSI